MFLLFFHDANFHHLLHPQKEALISMHDLFPLTFVVVHPQVDDAHQLQHTIDQIEILILIALVLPLDLRHAGIDHGLVPIRPDLVPRQEEEVSVDTV